LKLKKDFDSLVEFITQEDIKNRIAIILGQWKEDKIDRDPLSSIFLNNSMHSINAKITTMINKISFIEKGDNNVGLNFTMNV
jgi:hypothetical protein